jgi:FtsP/CotA-like multicopper oxidase with cupredoxin domain
MVSFTYVTYDLDFIRPNFAVQYSEGLVGPLIIHGPTVENWDVDLGTVLLQDYFHTSIFQEWFVERTKPPVHADNGLINGKNKNGNSTLNLFFNLARNIE